jgi:hypothetical protein
MMVKQIIKATREPNKRNRRGHLSQVPPPCLPPDLLGIVDKEEEEVLQTMMTRVHLRPRLRAQVTTS